MKFTDLRQYLIPKKLNNRNHHGEYDDSSFETEDLVWLLNEKDVEQEPEIERISGMTSFASKQVVYMSLGTAPSGKRTSSWMLRDGYGNLNAIEDDGTYLTNNEPYLKFLGVRPCIRFRIPEKLTEQLGMRVTDISYRKCMKIKSAFSFDGETKPYHVLNVGEYPTRELTSNEELEIEKLYKDRNNKLKCTGRWFSFNGNNKVDDKEEISLKHLPEYEYKGKKFVRCVVHKFEQNGACHKEAQWYEVTKIPYKIRNWDRLPKTINPLGTGEDTYFDLIAEDSLFRNLPFFKYKDVQNNTLWQNSTPRAFLNGISTNNIIENGNVEFGAYGGGDYTGPCNFLNESLNLTREPMVEYVIPDSVSEITHSAFEGCRTLKKLTIHSGVKNIGIDAFKDTSFKYMYRLKTGEIVFDENMPNDMENIDRLIDIEKYFGDINRTLIGVKRKITPEDLVRKDGHFDKIEYLSKRIARHKMNISYTFLEKLEDKGILEEFLDTSVFKYFRNEFPNIGSKLLTLPDEEVLDFFKFAKVLGCFSREKILDLDGKTTETPLAQKACTVLKGLLEKNIPFGKYHKLFDTLSVDIKLNQKLLKFLLESGDDEKKKTKLDLILGLESDCPGLFVKVISNFQDVAKQRQVIDKKTGSQMNISWEETFKKFYRDHTYEGITDENRDIADVYGKFGINQTYFNEATELRREAKENDVPEHLVGRELKEETILESIERIKDETEEKLGDAKTLIEGLYKKLFTYEWLSKKDPHNGILGLVCSCCATLMSEHYGREVARNSIIAKDLQNLVIRNAEGDIIAKGAVYVNKEKGYAVVNDFEVSEKYREDEDKENSGRYTKINTKAEEKRQLIYDAFVRGIEDFVTAYEETYPDRPPISQVNVGWGFNRLKNQVEKLERETNNLSVPTKYRFEDAEFRQYILYKRDNDKAKSNPNRKEEKIR